MTNDIRIAWHKVRRHVRTYWPRCGPGLAANTIIWASARVHAVIWVGLCSDCGCQSLYLSDRCTCADSRTMLPPE